MQYLCTVSARRLTATQPAQQQTGRDRVQAGVDGRKEAEIESAARPACRIIRM